MIDPAKLRPPGFSSAPQTTASTKPKPQHTPIKTPPAVAPQAPKPVSDHNPLRRHSLRGDAAELERLATDTTPLLGDFVMHGQATMIYAEPNAGKTLTVLRLLMDAIEAYNERD